MQVVYQIKESDEEWGPSHKLLEAVRHVRRRVNAHGGHGIIRWPWGFVTHSLGAAHVARRLLYHLPGKVVVGDVVIVKTVYGPIYVRKVKEDTKGFDVVRAALSHLGDPYVWGAKGPDAEDCSGLTYTSVQEATRIELPLSAETQRTAAIVEYHVVVDTNRNKLPTAKGVFDRATDGDLVFYNVGRLRFPAADHVGVVERSAGLSVIDASSTLGRVVHRNIDANPIIGFGKIKGVNA